MAISQVRENNEILEVLLESTDDMIWANEAEGLGLIAFNSALARYFSDNFGVELRLGMTPDDMLPPEAAKLWRDYCARVLREGPFSLEYEVVAKTHVLALSFNRLIRDGRCFGISVFGKDITARKRAELALGQSQQQVLDIAANIPGVLYQFVARPDGTMGVTYVSQRSQDILGLDAEPEGYFERVVACTAEADRERFLASIREAAERAQPWNYEGRYVKPSGEQIWLKGNSIPERRKEGLVFNGVILDITERKRVEQELRISEDKYKKAFRCSADVVLITSLPDGRILEANHRAERILGYSREELIGHTTTEICLWRDASQRPGFIDSILRDGFISNYETQFRKKSGELIDAIVTGELIELAAGKCTLSTIRDVSNARRTAQALEATQAAYRRVVDDAPIGIFCRHIESEDGYAFANPAMLQQLECRSLEDLNDRFGRVAQRWAHPERHDEFVAKLRREGRVLGFEVEVLFLDGRTKTFTLHAFLGVDDLIGGFSVDITGQRMAEQQRARLEQQVAQHQKLEALGTLSGGIAHDFNNILSAIVGYLDLALMEIPENSPTRDLLENIDRASMRAVDLVRQILAFSRQAPHVKKPIQPFVLVKEVLTLIRAGLPSTISIVAKVESHAWIMADPSQLHQVLMNLCTNANLAMRENGVVLEVRVDECEADAQLLSDNPELAPGHYLRLCVKDTGCGIPAQHLARIFEPFFTTRPQGQGTGLGLSVVHGIVKESGGAIRVASEVGRGTTFEIFFPRRDPGVAESQRDTHSIMGHGHVLVVDDEIALTNLARDGLERLGYRVTVFNDPTDALAAFEASPMSFDVVVTDMTMPKLTGDLLAIAIKRIRPDLPVILLSGFSDRITPERVKDAGIDSLGEKPLRPTALARLIAQLRNNR